MKRYLTLTITLIMLALLCACGDQAPTWQEQYDLGVRYLSEGNYEEAIIAFTAAIEIDPKQAPAYVGRGDAHVLSGETEENLAAALADYKQAISLDEASVEAYLGLADVYIAQGDDEKALEVLKRGYEITLDEEFISRIDTLSEPDKNAPFFSFSEYISLEDLSDEQITYIQGLIELTEAEDIQALFEQRAIAYDVLPHYRGNSNQVYFYCYMLGYKIQIIVMPEYDCLEIELRSENADAFFCDVNSSDIIRADYYFMRGTCKNWQWNGDVRCTSDTYWHDGGHDYSETIVCAEDNYRIGRNQTTWYSINSEGILVSNPEEPEIIFYAREDKMPLPHGICDKW